jgi:cephalosporin hydroxylase
MDSCVVPLGNFEPPVHQVEHTHGESLLIDAFGDLYYRKWDDGRGLSTIHVAWLGYETFKCPLDLWMYQELMVRERLDYVIETGTRFGGSALFMATVFELIGSGMVISVDSDYTVAPRRPLHRRLVYLSGSSTDEAIIEQVAGLVPAGKRVMVVLDSDHSRDHVLAEMRLYERFLLPGGHMIVEDTNINGHPTYPEFGPGPCEAVTAFLAERDDFEVDAACERFLLTMNPRGYLRKRIPVA